MPRVLLIDDDEIVRGTLSLTLRAGGYDCTTASNTLAGVALAEAGGFDIALIDINMPGLDGFEAIKAIAHVKPTVAIVAMSGKPYEDGRDSALLATSMGAHAFMLKPFRREDLVAAVDAAVKANRKAR